MASLVHEFMNKERGITDATLSAFGVTDEGDAILFPTGKYRRHDADGKRQFYYAPGKTASLLAGGNAANGIAFLVEGESDAMRLYQELGGSCDVFGIPGITTWKDEWAEQLKQYDEVLVVLDNDEDYKVAATVDRAWLHIRRSVGRTASRVELPAGVNDLCEFFDQYDLDAFRAVADRSTVDGGWHYQPLDLTQPLKKPDWLVEDLIAKGDLTMMIGEPGVGKSWLSMALAVAIVEGLPSFLGHNLSAQTGRVLYVDEENPEVLVPFRLRRLGLTDKGIKNMRFLHQQGVRVDKNPDYILEEALDFSPVLIVLDSLTRIHTKDENNAGEISALFNDGIIPLARNTGATVLVLHHVNKTDSTSSFARARGSSDLSGVIDCGLDARGKDGNIKLIQYKSRWRESGHVINLKLTDVEDRVELVTHKEVARF